MHVKIAAKNGQPGLVVGKHHLTHEEMICALSYLFKQMIPKDDPKGTNLSLILKGLLRAKTPAENLPVRKQILDLAVTVFWNVQGTPEAASSTIIRQAAETFVIEVARLISAPDT